MKPIPSQLLDYTCRGIRKAGFGHHASRSRSLQRLLQSNLQQFSSNVNHSCVETLQRCSPRPLGHVYVGKSDLRICCDLQIVIPAYNVEPFIDDCLSSVLGQQSSFRVKVVVVDDGSTDGSLAKIERYAKDERVVVYTQPNQGAATARNRGLNPLLGRYVMFVDADDWLPPGSVECLMAEAEAGQFDLVEGSFRLFFGGGDRYNHIHSRESGANARRSLRGFPCGKVIRSALLEHLRFPAGYWFEDTIMAYLLFPRCIRVATIDDFVYNYRRNPRGITSTARRASKALDTHWILELVLAELDRFNIGYSPEMLDLTLEHAQRNVRRTIHLGHTVGVCMLQRLSELLDQYFPFARTLSPELRDLEAAIRQRDYARYLLTALLAG